jgi:hypothetical protein
MTAAILQGVPATTLDADLWIDLPSRQDMTVLNLCRRLGATAIANTVVSLADDTLANFIYSVDGLCSFASEYKSTREIEWLGLRVRVLPLERVHARKKFVGRPKDVAHLPLLRSSDSIEKAWLSPATSVP